MGRDICIYHGNCLDGFGAAWVVRQAFPKTEFVAGFYDQPPPADLDACNLMIVDFSYKRPVLLEMAKRAMSILIIDHHKTAMEDLKDLPLNVTTYFDMNHSGAVLTWKKLYPTKAIWPLLEYIEDRDLWRFQNEGTREINACLFSYPYDFAVWDKLMTTPISTLCAEGAAIERKHHKDIDELLKVTQRWLRIGGHTVPAANLPYTLSSDAGHKMAIGQPFAACYWDTPTSRTFSLRSNNEGVDVSEIAKAYGGGGHRNASGFTVPREQVQEFEI